MDWFLDDRDPRHEIVKSPSANFSSENKWSKIAWRNSGIEMFQLSQGTVKGVKEKNQ